MFYSIIAYADEVASNPPTGTPTQNILSMFLPIAVAMVLLYFMMIRPQKKREKETKNMLEAMKVGDKIVTIGGICGKITKIKDEFIFIESGSTGNPNEKSYLKMERSAIKEVEQKVQN